MNFEGQSQNDFAKRADTLWETAAMYISVASGCLSRMQRAQQRD